MKVRSAPVAALLLATLLAACGGGSPPPAPSRSATSTPLPSPLPTGTASAAAPCLGTTAPAHYRHVIVVIMENKTLPAILNNPATPYESGVMHRCGYARNWQDAGRAYDSEPNYIAWASGIADTSTLRPYTCDCPPPPSAGAATCTAGNSNCSAADNLFRQVLSAGLTWKSYQEGMAGNCQETNGGEYAVKHNPAAFFFGGTDHAACLANDVGSSVALYEPGSPLVAALGHDNLPALTEITPNLCNDTHDCSAAVGDAYLAHLLPLILDSHTYAEGQTAVIVMWDEDTPIPNLVIAPAVKAGTVADSASHYGCLRAIEEMLGMPLLGAANSAGAEDLRTNFGI